MHCERRLQVLPPEISSPVVPNLYRVWLRCLGDQQFRPSLASSIYGIRVPVKSVRRLPNFPQPRFWTVAGVCPAIRDIRMPILFPYKGGPLFKVCRSLVDPRATGSGLSFACLGLESLLT